MNSPPDKGIYFEDNQVDRRINKINVEKRILLCIIQIEGDAQPNK